MSVFSNWFRPSLVGIDIGTFSVKAVELSVQTPPRVLAYNRIVLPPDTLTVDGEVRNPDSIVEALRRLFAQRIFTGKRVAFGVGGNALHLKKLSVPRMSRKDFANHLYWEAEQYIALPIQDVHIDFEILGTAVPKKGFEDAPQKPMMEVILVAAKRDYIRQLKRMARDANLTLEIVDTEAFALSNVFEFNYAHSLPHRLAAHLILDIGASGSRAMVVTQGHGIFLQRIPLGAASITKSVAAAQGISEVEAELLKVTNPNNAAVMAANQQFLDELKSKLALTMEGYLSQDLNRAIKAIYCCGGGSLVPGLLRHLTVSFGLPTAILNPIHSLSGSGSKLPVGARAEIVHYGAIACGLSLRGVTPEK